MATISNTPRPGYVWDSTDNVWYPIGTGPHTHSDYITSSSAINPNIVDAKGDIIAATAADTVARLAVGSNDQVLTADSSTATGLKWATPSSGGMTLISETVASANTSITLGSISGSYKQLILIWSGLYCSNATTEFAIRFNNTSTSSYHTPLVGFYGTTPTFYWNQSGPMDYAAGFQTYGASTTSLTPSSKGRLIVDNYASTTKLKTYSWHTFAKRDNGNFQAQQELSGIFDSTSAITSIDIYRHEGSGTLSNATNTSIRLYGIS